MVLAVFILEELEPVGSHFHEVGEVVVYLVNLRFDASHQLIRLVFVELQDALHLDFQQLEDVVLGDLTYHLRIVRCQSLVDMLANSIDSRCLFEFLIFIDTLLDEYLLEGVEMQLLQQFPLADLQLLSDEVFRPVHRVAQHIRYGEELWFVILDDTTVG